MALSSSILSLVLRGFQFLFGIVVLGLSVTLIRGHHYGSTPASLGFGAAVGGISILASLFGIAATWISFLEGIIGLAVDSVVALINIAGGVVSYSLNYPFPLFPLSLPIHTHAHTHTNSLSLILFCHIH